MHIVVFGLTVGAPWGDGHVIGWRGLMRALVRLGHHVTFFERGLTHTHDRRTRELERPEQGEVRQYERWEATLPDIKRALAAADVGMVTSSCPDAIAAAEVVLRSRARCKVYYELDAPVTLALVRSGRRPDTLGSAGLGLFDLVLSSTGGAALGDLRALLGARRVVPLYASVDPDFYRPALARDGYRADILYLGAWATDRVAPMEALLLAVARARPTLRVLVAGALYPPSYPFPRNVVRLEQVALSEHPALYASSRLTLSLTRGDGPSTGLFEAAACAAPIVTNGFPGIDRFFAPGRELRVVHSTADALSVIELPDEELTRMGHAARERVLSEHTSCKRAEDLCEAVEAVWR